VARDREARRAIRWTVRRCAATRRWLSADGPAAEWTADGRVVAATTAWGAVWRAVEWTADGRTADGSGWTADDGRAVVAVAVGGAVTAEWTADGRGADGTAAGAEWTTDGRAALRRVAVALRRAIAAVALRRAVAAEWAADGCTASWRGRVAAERNAEGRFADGRADERAARERRTCGCTAEQGDDLGCTGAPARRDLEAASCGRIAARRVATSRRRVAVLRPLR